jgi:Uma2 family endonuclease
LYSKQELELLNTNLDSLKGIFEKRKALSSLQGIEVYFIYQPNNAVEDKDYRLVSDFYRSLLESKGAIVHISANLIN